ncbi:MAG: flavodoxin domain-containing protein [Sphaerochaetaceae bacterium]
MKTLIVYASKRGYVQECAQKLAELIGDGSGIARIGNEANKKNLADYQAVIMGASVHMGRVPGALHRFGVKHQTQLMEKAFGLFLCGLDSSSQDTILNSTFSPALNSHAMGRQWFGGRLILKQYNPIIRKMLGKVMGNGQDVHAERPEAIAALAQLFSGPATIG